MKNRILLLGFALLSNLAIANESFNGTVNYMVGLNNEKEQIYPIFLIKKNGKTDLSSETNNQIYFSLKLKKEQGNIFKQCIGKNTNIIGQIKQNDITANTKFEIDVSNISCSQEVIDPKFSVLPKDRMLSWAANCSSGYTVKSKISLESGNKNESYNLSKVSKNWEKVAQRLGKDFHFSNDKVYGVLDSSYKNISEDVAKNGNNKLNSVTGRCNMWLDTDIGISKLYLK